MRWSLIENGRLIDVERLKGKNQNIGYGWESKGKGAIAGAEWKA